GALQALPNESSTTLAKLAVLFGEGFRVLSPFTLDPNADFVESMQRRQRAGDAKTADVIAWLQIVSRVRDGARRLTSAMTYADAVGTAGDTPFQVAQFPFDDQDRWNVPEGVAVAGATSLVMRVASAVDFSVPCAGLMIDEWVETVPRRTAQTAVAFHYDA